MSVVFVYVPAPSHDNLEIGIAQSVWGWRQGTVARGGTQAILNSLRAGDYLLLGHRGPNARVAPGGWSDATVRRLVVARLAGPVYHNTAGVWPDDVYPTRIPLEIMEDYSGGASAALLGAEAMELLRLSANKQGAPVPAASSDALDQLIDTTSDTELDDLDGAAPEGERYLDLPGDLDRAGRTLARREQGRLRRQKFGNASQITCALCGRMLPARLVHTAHIKRRSQCDFTERRDLANIMGACVLGCDALFEHGYLYVGSDGTVTFSSKAAAVGELGQLVTAQTGQACSAFNEGSAPYFTWHRETIAEAAE